MIRINHASSDGAKNEGIEYNVKIEIDIIQNKLQNVRYEQIVHTNSSLQQMCVHLKPFHAQHAYRSFCQSFSSACVPKAQHTRI
jgi:hypothetical protein